MQDFILNIDNKEILIEILHHSIDYLIETANENLTTIKFSHKFGFANPEEFEFAIKFIASAYRQFLFEQITETELILHFAHLNQDLQQSVIDVINTRRPEVEEFLITEYNSRENALIDSFDWDIKLVMGTSRMASLRQQLATLVLHCRSPPHTTISPNLISLSSSSALSTTLSSVLSTTSDESNNRKKKIFFEMNQKKLQELIRLLEECEQKMDSISSDNLEVAKNSDIIDGGGGDGKNIDCNKKPNVKPEKPAKPIKPIKLVDGGLGVAKLEIK